MNFNFDLLFKVKEFREKIFFTFLMLFIYRIGIFITIPGFNFDFLKNKVFDSTEFSKNLVKMFDFFSGGALENFSIFALGIMPYITSSILMSIIVNIFPYFELLQKDGYIGLNKINKITKLISIIIALFQSFLMIKYLENYFINSNFTNFNKDFFLLYNGWFFYILSSLTLTTGAIFSIWISEFINIYGIGNGISLIIFSSLLSKMPSNFYNIFFNSKNIDNFFILFYFFFFLFFIFFLIIFIEKSYINISLKYVKWEENYNDFFNSNLPLKINNYGVMPPIFASTVLLIFGILFSFLKLDFLNVFFLKTSNFLYNFFFSLLIFFFTYFYSYLYFNIREISNNINKSGCFIYSIKIGNSTINYINYIINRINLGNSIYLSFICIIPNLIQFFFVNNVILFLGGTGLLIIISVSLDIFRNLESLFVIKKYNEFI